MHSAVLLGRAVLALVFLTAAGAKLADLNGTRETVEAFGLPVRVARIAGTLLPFAEMTVGVALLITPAARWAGVGSLLLLVVFSGGAGYALSQGRHPDCNCFGQLGSAEIGPRTLVRNLLLGVIAVLVIWRAPGSSLDRWTSDAAAANLVAALALLAAAGGIVLALHYRAQAASRRDVPDSGEATETASPSDRQPLAPGQLAPSFTASDVNGSEVTLESLRARGLPVMLVFASPICGPCHRLLPQLANWSRTLRERLVIAVIESGVPDVETLTTLLEEPGDLLMVAEPGFAAAARFMVGQTPTGIIVGADGTVEAEPHTGAIAIERLVRATLRRQPGTVSGAV